MNRTIDYLILFTSGLLLGIFSTKKYWETEYSRRAEEEIESVKRAYGAKTAKNSEKTEESKDSDVPDKPIFTSPNLYGGERLAENEVDYGKYYEKTEGGEDSTQVRIMEMAEKEFPRENEPPRMITEEEYYDTETSFDKMSCTLYAPNRVVVDDISREVLDDYIVGDDNLEFMCDKLPKLVYIRNESISCDLEISVETSSIEDLDALVYFK